MVERPPPHQQAAPPSSQSARDAKPPPRQTSGAAGKAGAKRSAAADAADAADAAGLSAPLLIDPTPAPHNDPAIVFDWRAVDLGANRSFACTVSTTEGHALRVVVEQPPYRKTSSGTGSLAVGAVPVAAAGTKGTLIALDESSGARAECHWEWQHASGARSALRKLWGRLIAPGAKGRGGAARQSRSAAPVRRTGDDVATTQFFGQVARGQRFAFVLDRSGSMAGIRWNTCKRELALALGGLAAPAEFFVILFSSGVLEPPDQTGWTVAEPEAIAAVLAWIDSIVPYGGTCPAPAFARVFALPARPDVVFFLTDGEIEGFGVAACARLRADPRPSFTDALFRRLPWRGATDADDVPSTVINTVSLDERPSAIVLQAIADESGGQYVHATSTDA